MSNLSIATYFNRENFVLTKDKKRFAFTIGALSIIALLGGVLSLCVLRGNNLSYLQFLSKLTEAGAIALTTLGGALLAMDIFVLFLYRVLQNNIINQRAERIIGLAAPYRPINCDPEANDQPDIQNSYKNKGAYLDLGGCRITATGAETIAATLQDNKTCTSLNLAVNQIGDKGAIAIAELLKKNTTITHLDLAVNKIGDKGAIAIAEALKANTHLKHLYLGSNQIGKEGARAIREAFASNNSHMPHLDLSFNNMEDEEQ